MFVVHVVCMYSLIGIGWFAVCRSDALCRARRLRLALNSTLNVDRRGAEAEGLNRDSFPFPRVMCSVRARLDGGRVQDPISRMCGVAVATHDPQTRQYRVRCRV